MSVQAMTKEKFLEKIQSKPKKAHLLVRWKNNGTGNPYTMIYSGHDDNNVFGVDPRGQNYTMRLNQIPFITELTYFKPDIMTKNNMVYSMKVPYTSDRYVGVEMEIVSKLDTHTLVGELAKAGLEHNVNVRGDGSIHTTSAYPYPHEICILAKEKEMAIIIKKVCKILKGNSSVNKSCGLHVHLDMRNRNKDASYANLYAAQALLYAMCPRTRLTNNFCKPTNQYRKMEAMQAGDRYYGINASAYGKHKTIEVRIHSGSVNAFKIINWVKLLIQIADKPTENIERVAVWKNIKEVKKLIGLRGALEKYVSSRIEEFAEDHEDSEMRMTA